MSIFLKNFFWENPSGGGPKETQRGGGGWYRGGMQVSGKEKLKLSIGLAKL